MNKVPYKSYGLTLIELLVVIAVVVTLVMFAVPSFKKTNQNSRMITVINGLIGDLNLARSEAISRGQTVTICATTDGTNCDTSNWETGWIIFTDATPANATVDAGDSIIKVRRGLSGGLTLRTKYLDNAGYLHFRSNGELRDTDGDGKLEGTFILCDKDGNTNKAKAINITTVGRSSSAIDTNGTPDGILNDINNNNITCP